MIQIHVDVDNLWMYEQEFGISIYHDREYIYTHSLPLFLTLLKKYRSKATFMLIGKDLNLPACRAFCLKAVSSGHEIANHTWNHPVSFGTMSYEQKEEEIITTHQQITKLFGKAPVGFRGPGYYQDKEIITILQKLNYLYDSSTLPGFAQILMGTYASMNGDGNKHKAFGRTDYIIAKEQPYMVTGVEKKQKLLELPISVLPFVRLPIHTTFAYFFGPWYYQLIIQYLKSKPVYILYLFHAIDFVDLPVYHKNHPVIPLRYSFHQRMHVVQRILSALVEANEGPLMTSRNLIKNSSL